jgi:DNA mismatch endonuclease, patch repair protein
VTDRISSKRRSWNMSRIRGKDTKPELVVRSLLHRMGFRYRLHVRTLPCCPDIVLSRWRSIVLVHGCFWHRHRGCNLAYTPKTRGEFWKKKFRDNVRRDRNGQNALLKLGWRVLIVWECEIQDIANLQRKLKAFLRTH